MITFFCYGNTINFLGYAELFNSKFMAIKELFSNIWPLIYALVGYSLIWILANYYLYALIDFYCVKIIQSILFIIWYLPVLVYTLKRLGGWSVIKKLINR